MSERYGEVNDTFPDELAGLLAVGAAEVEKEKAAADAARRERQELEDAVWRKAWDDVRAVIATTVPAELAAYVDDGEPEFRRAYGPTGENMTNVSVSINVPGCEPMAFAVERTGDYGPGHKPGPWKLVSRGGSPFEVIPVAGSAEFYATAARALYAARQAYQTRAKREADQIPF